LGALKLLRGYAVMVFLTMLALIVWASLQENVVAAFLRMLRDPWSVATLADCGFGFFAFWLWLLWKERSMPRAIPWLLAIMGLGNLAIAAYLLLAAARLESGEGIDALVSKRRAI
jgi:hypothetical protein